MQLIRTCMLAHVHTVTYNTYFFVSVQLTIHGVSKTTWTRLSANASAGSNTLQLQGNAYPNWGVTDEIVIAPSSWEPTESEIRTISSYDITTGMGSVVRTYSMYLVIS